MLSPELEDLVAACASQPQSLFLGPADARAICAELQRLRAGLQGLRRYDYRVANDGDGRTDVWEAEDDEGDYVLWGAIQELLK